jgi:AraC-like DNA-binding protein
MDVPSYSARFIPPFAQALATYDGYAVGSLDKLRAIDPASRIPTLVAHDLAQRQVADTGDLDLGFKAARYMLLGRAGALDYAMRSAATLRRAIEVGDRYVRAFSDVLRMRIEVKAARASLRLTFRGPMPRAIADFTMATLYENHLRAALADPWGLECWFGHLRPHETSQYERVFAPATLRFAAEGYGFAFDASLLDAPLDSSDPALHALLCDHLAETLDHLTSCSTLVARVRETTMSEMAPCAPTIFTVARRLHMSPRTLGRRLEREGTTFSAVLEGLRRDLALQYVLHHDEATFVEIAFRLGYAHVEAFHRAFKRWTGSTPLAYRRSRGAPG